MKTQKALGRFLFLCPVLLLAACGGGGRGSGGGFVPTPPPAPEPEPARTLTSEEIRAIAVGFTHSANSLLQSDNLAFSDGGRVHRAATSCVGDTCTTTFLGSPAVRFVAVGSLEDVTRRPIGFGSSQEYRASRSLSGFGFDNPELEYQSVMSHRGVSLAKESGRVPVENETVDVLGYGGWLEHSYFAARTHVIKGGGSEGAGTSFSFVLGNATGTNPTSGSGTWEGVMVGVDVSETDARGNPIQGDAAITIGDFLNPMVGVGFSNVFNLEAGTTRPDMTWQDIPLTDGSFQSGSGSDQIKGQFYGPNHEEVGGIFERNLILGAFGAKRE